MQDHVIVYETYIRTTPDNLWQGLTDGEQTAKWCYGSPIVSTWQVGDAYTYMTPDHSMALIRGKILDVQSKERIVIDYQMLYNPKLVEDKPSREIWEIEDMGGVCKLRVTHDQFEGETATYHEVKRGLPWIFSSLKSLMETGEAFPNQG